MGLQYQAKTPGITIDFITLTWILVAVVIFAYELTLIDYCPDLAAKSMICLMLLVTGLTMGKYFVEKKPRWKDYTLWVQYTLIAIFVVLLINVAVGTWSEHATRMSVVTSPALFAVLIGISEEAFFRGFLMMTLYMYTHSKWVSIVASSVIWAAFHSAVYHAAPYAIVVIFFSGLVLGWIVFETKRLSPTMTAHALVNLLAFAAGGI